MSNLERPTPGEVCADLAAHIAELDGYMRDMDLAADIASADGDQHGIRARFNPCGALTSLVVPPSSPLTFSAPELGSILTDVLQKAFDASQAAASAVMGGSDESPAALAEQTYAEASRHGDVTIALDARGRARWCTLSRTAGRWEAAELAQRILLLHNAAAMRVISITPRYGTAASDAAKENMVTDEKIAQYRLQHLTF